MAITDKVVQWFTNIGTKFSENKAHEKPLIHVNKSDI